MKKVILVMVSLFVVSTTAHSASLMSGYPTGKYTLAGTTNIDVYGFPGEWFVRGVGRIDSIQDSAGSTLWNNTASNMDLTYVFDSYIFINNSITNLGTSINASFGDGHLDFYTKQSGSFNSTGHFGSDEAIITSGENIINANSAQYTPGISATATLGIGGSFGSALDIIGGTMQDNFDNDNVQGNLLDPTFLVDILMNLTWNSFMPGVINNYSQLMAGDAYEVTGSSTFEVGYVDATVNSPYPLLLIGVGLFAFGMTRKPSI